MNRNRLYYSNNSGKRGGYVSEIVDIDTVCRIYNGEIIEYRRVVKTTMKYC